ncbi:MAG: VWA domain-containing protein [Rhodospirillaceae bacterium]
MTEGYRPLPNVDSAEPETEGVTTDVAEVAPTAFWQRDLGIASSLGQLTASLFGTRAASSARQSTRTEAPVLNGRLIFAMDATASREDSWDRACHIQSEMFDAVSELGSLDVQLVHFRGLCGFSASPWYHDSKALRARMVGVTCQSGRTQLRRVLTHATKETRHHRIAGIIYVGDTVEEEAGPLRELAGVLGMLGTPIFVFHEIACDSKGNQTDPKGPQTEATLRDIAQLSGGAYCPFDPASADQLRSLLRAIAVYAVGGRLALPDLRPNRGGKADGRIVDLAGMLYQQMRWRRSV